MNLSESPSVKFLDKHLIKALGRDWLLSTHRSYNRNDQNLPETIFLGPRILSHSIRINNYEPSITQTFEKYEIL